jgi:transglutaminase-like putative cysteine protease
MTKPRRIIDVSSMLEYEIFNSTSFIFNIAVAGNERQRVLEETLEIVPDTETHWFDLNDEGCRSIRLSAEPGYLKVCYRATVELSPELGCAPNLGEVPHRELPVEVLPYLNPSRYCESDRLARFAWKEFGGLASGYERVNSICDWVNDCIDYQAGSTDASSSACDVLLQRAGVCRDFAHVGVALCRALGLPARYVSGYSVGLEPPDFHGFFEVYLEDDWYLFDPTRMAPVNGFVRIGLGRDAADAPFANIVGYAILCNMSVTAMARGGESLPDSGKSAVSSA